MTQTTNEKSRSDGELQPGVTPDHRPACVTGSSDSETTPFYVSSDKYVYGFDPARGDDCAARCRSELQPDGTVKVIDVQIWDKKRNEWVPA